MIDVVWLPPSGLDQFMMRDLLENKLWSPVRSYEFRHVESFDDTVEKEVVLMLPGGYHKAEDINKKIKAYRAVLIMIVSDENNDFEVEKLSHPNMKVWVQYPRTGRDYGDVRYFGAGYAEARKYKGHSNRELDIFLSAQDTHIRRHKMFKSIEKYATSHQDMEYLVVQTKGFMQGMKAPQYYKIMSDARIAPAPSGTTTPDSFRVYEALELGVIPIADDISPRYDSKGYWARLFPDTPMPIMAGDNLSDILDFEIPHYAQRRNQIFAWWQQQKRKYAYDLTEDLNFLTKQVFNSKWSDKQFDSKDHITAIIPVSPWASHPDTRILEETIANTRAHLPEAEIIVTFDGVRPEQMDRNDDYQEFVIRMLHKMNDEYTNVLPIVFQEHMHQSGMAREVMKYVRTETIVYIEGDSPLYADRPVPWLDLIKQIEHGKANVIRLYNKEVIPEEHEYLMLHDEDNKDLELVATRQWSQQPHIASTNFYRTILDLSTGYFTEDAKCFIEEKMYYIIASESRNGQEWKKWRMFIYKPADNLPRSYHLDGREGGPSFYDKQVF